MSIWNCDRLLKNALVSPKKQVHRRDAKAAKGGCFFWRIAERPILQKLQACGHRNT
jgi:hypothetical protein